MQRRILAAALAALVPVLILAGCGGSPSSSSDEGVSLQGTLLGEGVASASAVGRGSAAETITVTVAENPAIVATVGADGRFSLRGLPEGGFTLVFTSGGVRLGSIAFAELKANQQITLTVRVEGSTIVVVEERRNGIGHGDVEIEGRVDAVSALDPSADSVFVIDGHRVVARPGQTTIREGNRARSVNDVTVGRQVHVKGVFLPADTRDGQGVLALEIKLQGGDDNGGGTMPPRGSCAAGTQAEVEWKHYLMPGQSPNDFVLITRFLTRQFLLSSMTTISAYPWFLAGYSLFQAGGAFQGSAIVGSPLRANIADFRTGDAQSLLVPLDTLLRTPNVPFFENLAQRTPVAVRQAQSALFVAYLARDYPTVLPAILARIRATPGPTFTNDMLLGEITTRTGRTIAQLDSAYLVYARALPP